LRRESFDGLRLFFQAGTLSWPNPVNLQVSVGGGSTIGLGKALALHSGEGKDKIKQIVIPTTCQSTAQYPRHENADTDSPANIDAGSEATPIIGQTEKDKDGQPLKTTQKTNKVLPDTIIYDVSLTLSLPISMTVTSALNAIAHSVEALWAPSPNPITSSLALQGISALAKALPVLTKSSQDKDARMLALFGAYACGTVLGTVGMSLHHKLVKSFSALSSSSLL